MSDLHPTCIARVSHVLGATVTARLNPDLAGVAPLWRGQVHPIGQVGSIVAIPQGPRRLLASVVLVGLAELSEAPENLEFSQPGDRWLRLQLLGELDALGNFHRGVSSYPGLDDPVHFVSPEVLKAIYPGAGRGVVSIGHLSANTAVPLTLNVKKLVTRHSALVGSTGAGKTSAVATIIQSFVLSGCTGANIVVVDPHGEYAQALDVHATVRSVTSTEPNEQLRVPFWALPAADLLRALAGPAPVTANAANRFAELVAEEKAKYAESSTWITSTTGISADTPIPFDLRQVWYTLDYENRRTDSDRGVTPAVIDEGDASRLVPASFRPHSTNNTAPYRGAAFDYYSSAPERIRSRIADPRFAFFMEPGPENLDADPLHDVIADWLGGDKPVSVLNFSGIPAEVADLAIGAVLQLIFEVSIRSSSSQGIGRNRPTLVVIEEAHRFLSDNASARLASESVNRIAREGRKYGVGLMLVTQRPSELPDTALSQAGTVIALRLTNAADQGKVRAGLPDSLEGLAEALPALRTGEAIVTGEAVGLPARVLISMPSPAPLADDPSIDGWFEASGRNDLTTALANWRGTQSGGQ